MHGELEKITEVLENPAEVKTDIHDASGVVPLTFLFEAVAEFY